MDNYPYTDQQVVEALLARNPHVTKDYLYRKCYPLFSAIFFRYDTGCENVIEFITELYVYLLTPNRRTGQCKLAGFGYRCTLTGWLKIVALHYCHQLYALKQDCLQENFPDEDRFAPGEGSFYADDPEPDGHTSLRRDDLSTVLHLMPNERYRQLLELRYLEELTNEETAQRLQLTMSNYYNAHLRAKAQLRDILRKEGLL